MDVLLEAFADKRDLAREFAVATIVANRNRVCERMRRAIEEEQNETWWQKFLWKNHWVIGNAYITKIADRRINIHRTADYLMQTEDKSLEIIEIKEPGFPIWALKKKGGYSLYRGCRKIHSELNGAISQVSHYIFDLEKQANDADAIKDRDNIAPIKPRAVIIHGRSDGWNDEDVKEFRLLNDRLSGIRVMTFDHLVAAAERLVDLLSSQDLEEIENLYDDEDEVEEEED